MDKLSQKWGVQTVYLHVDVTNEVAATIYKKAGYIRADSHIYHEEFTRSLNLHDDAIQGRCHDLMFKQIIN